MVKVNVAENGGAISTVEHVVNNPLYNQKYADDIVEDICKALKKAFKADAKVKVETDCFAVDEEYLDCCDDFDCYIALHLVPVVIIDGTEYYIRNGADGRSIILGGDIWNGGNKDNFRYSTMIKSLWKAITSCETLKLAN